MWRSAACCSDGSWTAGIITPCRRTATTTAGEISTLRRSACESCTSPAACCETRAGPGAGSLRRVSGVRATSASICGLETYTNSSLTPCSTKLEFDQAQHFDQPSTLGASRDPVRRSGTRRQPASVAELLPHLRGHALHLREVAAGRADVLHGAADEHPPGDLEVGPRLAGPLDGDEVAAQQLQRLCRDLQVHQPVSGEVRAPERIPTSTVGKGT